MLDATVANIALPETQQDLGFSDGSRQPAAGSSESLVAARVAQGLFAALLAPAALSLLSVTFTEPQESRASLGWGSASTERTPPARLCRVRQPGPTIGPEAFLAPEHKVVLVGDAEEARAVGRQTVEMDLSLKNALANWKWRGFSDEDLAKPGSDRLVDAVVAHGTADAIAAG